MNRRTCSSLLGLILLSICLPAGAASIEDFDKIGAVSDGEQSILRVELPFSVLQAASRSDLADVHVFDARGQLVPSNTYYVRSGGETLESVVELPFYPFGAEAQRDAIRYSFQVDQARQNTRINVSPDSLSESDSAKTNYVVHIPRKVRRQHGVLSQLTLEWAKPDENLIVPIRIEGSADLQQWKTLVDQAVVSDLEHNGTTLVANQIKLSPSTVAYLRLTWPDSVAQFELEKISGEFTRRHTQPAPLRVQRLACDPPLNDICQFELSPQISVESFNVPTSLPRYFMQGHIFSARTRKGEGKLRWIRRGQFQQYQLTVDEQDIQNAKLRLPDTRDRLWQLRFDQPLADLGVTGIEVSWYPVYQTFLAQGEGPYRLAFGHAEAINPQRSSMDAILARAKLELDDIEQVRLSEVQTVVQSYWTRKRLEVFVLWAVLLIGVAVLFRIAWRLFRSMNGAVGSE